MDSADFPVHSIARLTVHGKPSFTTVRFNLESVSETTLNLFFSSRKYNLPSINNGFEMIRAPGIVIDFFIVESKILGFKADFL